MFLFFRQFEPQVFLFLFWFIHVLINCNLHTWQLLYTQPVERAGNFQFQKGKKENLKNFSKYKSIVYNKLLIDSKRLLWYIFLFLTEHNPSFTLFLICSYFLPNLSFDVLIKCVLIKKRGRAQKRECYFIYSHIFLFFFVLFFIMCFYLFDFFYFLMKYQC